MTLAIFLPDESNEYQQKVKEDALEAARKAGLKLDVFFAGDKVTTQIRQIYECLHSSAQKRPVAILTIPGRVNALNRLAREVLQNGIGLVCMNRRMDNFQTLREEFPGLPVSFVSPDQIEIGRIQGRQFRELLPSRHQILYVQGDATSSPAKDRLAGMREAIRGSRIEEASVLDGNWTARDAERVVGAWLRIVMSGTLGIDLVGCQNDAMAVGARKALISVAEYLKRPDLARVPITGCDGVPNFGQKLVKEGHLAATVVMPSTGGAAVQLIARALNSSVRPPAEVFLPASSYPAEGSIGKARTSAD
jgi:ABC-type sugar transport system substrate-binding protein